MHEDYLSRLEKEDSYQYYMNPDPNTREFLSDLKEEYDPITRKKAHYKWANISMVRGGERKNNVKVYLKFDDKPYEPHIRVKDAAKLRGWYQSKGEAKASSRERPCMSEAMLTTPYGGYCTVGCAFCYINSGFKGYRGSKLITVPLNYGDTLSLQLSKSKAAAPGYFSSFTDPFLRLEGLYNNTRNGVKAFTDNGLPIFFLSRLSYPGWAIDALKLNKHSYAQKSLNTSSPEDFKKLSPGALGLLEHIEEIKELRKQGIYTSIQVNPIVPGVTTVEEIETLFDMLAEVGNNHVIVKFVEANYPWAPSLVDKIIKKFGDNRGKYFQSLFVDNMGGQRCVDQEYRLDAHRRLSEKAKKVGMTYATCYEYEYTEGKKTRSIGKDFLTADQCHGHRTPLYFRKDLNSPFKPFEGCAPSGCLSCEEDLGKPAPCGSKNFSSAIAHTAATFKKGFDE